MPKRPWDRGFAASLFKKEGAPPPCPPRQDESGNINRRTASAVEVDGVEFYSDRFYLNRPEGTTEEDVKKTAVPPPYNGAPPCKCGARGPPPLLDRGRLVESLSLKAAVLATFPFDPIAMANEMPSLFGPTANIPTLVLHGDKRLRKWLQEKEEEEDSSPTKRAKLDEPESSEEEEENEISPTSAGLTKVGRMKATMKSSQIKKEEEPPEEAFLRMTESAASVEVETCLGQSVHVTEILPMWMSPHAKRRMLRQPSDSAGSKSDVVVLDDSDDESGHQDSNVQGVSSAIIKHRTRRPGVHHPKCMILFETSGSVIVVVSTCNLTRQTSADASWLQRFPAHSATGPIESVTDAMRRDGSDFGYVLADYLECQSNAAQKGQMIPQEFLKKYLGYDSLDAFRRGFRFEDSSVHLIATVPGEYRGLHGATHLDTRNEQPFLYGAQRVADVVSRLSQQATSKTGKEKPWLPSALLSSEDRLVIQPTSFGGFLTGASLAAIGRLYLGIDRKEGKAWSSRDTDILDRTDIVWPSMDFLRNLNKERKARRVGSPDSVAGETISAESPDKSSAKFPLSFLFLSSASFNTCELSSLSCMAMYESSVPMQLPLLLGPHIKSCIRVFEGNEYQLRKEHGTEKAEEIIPYAVLTSACLSRGAQGQPYPPGSLDTGERSYFNFELGVLFASRLTGDRGTDRQYCWRPTRCTCNEEQHWVKDQRVQMVHMPFPFCLRPQSFQPDPEEADMCATPFMHEVPKGTGFVGNMKLTPLGVKFAAQQK